MCKKNYIWNPATSSCENGKYLGRIMADSVIICNEIIDTIKTIATKSTSTKAILIRCASINFYILLGFLLITIALLTAISILWYLINHWTKQKPLLPCHTTPLPS